SFVCFVVDPLLPTSSPGSAARTPAGPCRAGTAARSTAPGPPSTAPPAAAAGPCPAGRSDPAGRGGRSPPPCTASDSPPAAAAGRLDLQQRRADLVTLADQDAVVDDDGVAGVGALEEAGAPGEVEVLLARGRVQRQQAAAREDEAVAPLADRPHDRRGVAGEV